MYLSYVGYGLLQDGQSSEVLSSPTKLLHPTSPIVRVHDTSGSSTDLHDSSLEMDDIRAMLDLDTAINGFDRQSRLSGGSSGSGHHSRKSRPSYQRPHSVDISTLNNSMTIDDLVSSPPQLSLQPVTQLANGSDLVVSPSRSDKKSTGSTSEHQVVPSFKMCTAIQDYQPHLYSRSGHQRLELSLKEGQQVKVIGKYPLSYQFSVPQIEYPLGGSSKKVVMLTSFW